MKIERGAHLVGKEDQAGISPYAFEDASVLPVGQAPLLDVVLRRWARQMGDYFFDQYKIEAYVGCSVVNRVHFSEFTELLQGSRPYYFFRLTPFEGEGMFVLDNALSGWYLARQGMQKSLSAANQTYLKPFAEKMLATFVGCGKGILPVQTGKLSRVTNSHGRGRLLEDFEICFVAWAHVSIGDVQGKIGWCLPYIMLHSIVEQLEQAPIIPTDVMEKRGGIKVSWDAFKKTTQMKVGVALGDVASRQLALTLLSGEVCAISSLGNRGKVMVTLGQTPFAQGEVGEVSGDYAVRIDENVPKDREKREKKGLPLGEKGFSALKMHGMKPY